MGKNFLRKIGIVAANLLISALVGMLLLDIVYLMPTTKMEINASDAIFLFNSEGSHCGNDSHYVVQSITDNYSDSIILSNCFLRVLDAPFYKEALRDAYISAENETGAFFPVEAYINYFSYAERFWGVYTYSRYWNGYQVILIPLLQFFSYSKLRTLNLILLVLLTAAASICVYRKYSWRNFLAFLCMVFSLYPFYIYKTFQTSRIFNLTMLAVIAFCILKKEKRELLFLYVGIVIAYLDLFSYPCLAPGILAVLTAIDMKEEKDNIKVIKTITAYMMLFVAGYIGMWLMKWLLSAVVLGPEIFTTVFEQVALHTGGDVTFMMGFKNIFYLLSLIFMDYVVLLLVGAAVIAVVFGFTRGFNQRIWQDALLFGIMALMPVALCLLIKGHACRHPFFDFRDFGITVFALFSWLLNIPAWDKKIVNKNSLE